MERKLDAQTTPSNQLQPPHLCLHVFVASLLLRRLQTTSLVLLLGFSNLQYMQEDIAGLVVVDLYCC
jgi:hypothetical protein